MIRQPRNINHIFLTVHLCFVGNSALPFYFYISKLHQTPNTNFKEHIQYSQVTEYLHQTKEVFREEVVKKPWKNEGDSVVMQDTDG